MKDFTITRVVTKDLVTDMFQDIRNLFGFRLRGYERMINIATKEMLEEMNLKYNKIEFYRFSINPLGNKSCMITLYGRGNNE